MDDDKKIPPRPDDVFGVGGENKSIETYAEDMAEIINNDKEGGLIKKIIQQQEEKDNQNKNLFLKSKNNMVFMLMGILLILGAIATLVFLVILKKNISTVEIQETSVPIIFTDESIYKDVSLFNKEKIAQTVFNEVNIADGKKGAVKGIYLMKDKKIISLGEFVRLINGSLIVDNTSFINDNFLIGAVNQETKNLFILLQVRSFGDIFGNMRAWEKKMFSDMHGFFGIDITGETNYLSIRDFEDGIVENKNARILKDKMGDIVMMYVFVDDQFLIIADTLSAVHEVTLRLKASEVKK